MESGDIWASTFSVSTKPLENYTDSWGELNAKVLELGGGSTKRNVKLLGISLKKVTTPTASLQEYSTPALQAQRETYEWQSWSWGKTGVSLIHRTSTLIISGKEVQFRTFGGDTSWQGEVKGTAAGGKIGGGNVNFYAKKIFSKDIYNGATGRTAEKQYLTEATAEPNKLDEQLYAGYIDTTKTVHQNYQRYQRTNSCRYARHRIVISRTVKFCASIFWMQHTQEHRLHEISLQRTYFGMLVQIQINRVTL